MRSVVWRTEIEFQCWYCSVWGEGTTAKVMIPKSAPMTRILVVEDVQETRDAIEALLKRDGYWVDPARNEHDAVEKIRLNSPDVILISLGGTTEHVLSTARGIRERSGLLESTPIVIFSILTIPEGAEVDIGGNIYVTAPDNFNQLRRFLKLILDGDTRKQ
jgi:DNA-binding response OmpR family regulator